MSVTLSTSPKPAATTDGGSSSATGSLNGRVVARLSEEEKTSLVRDFLLSKEKTKIGEGAYSRVYSCSQGGKQYAVKTLAKKTFLNEREACIGPLLSHPNIVVHHGCGKAGEQAFLIMDYAGKDLSFDSVQNHFSIIKCDKSDRLRRWNNCQVLISQIRSALQYMHYNHYMYRDLKEENICIVMKDGRLEHATLVDLAFVRHTDTDDGLPPSSGELRGCRVRRYSICGSQSTMSLQMLKRESYTVKTDVWSLGCLLYFVLAEEEIFEFLTAEDPLLLPKWLPESAKDLLRKLLSKKEKNRPFLSKIVDHLFFTTEKPEFPEDGK